MMGSLGSGGGYSLQMASSAESALADRSPINIAPIGFNLGEILQPIAQGGPENGGIGADFMQRYTGGGQALGAFSKGINWPLIIAIPGAILAVYVLMKLKGG